jgi:heptosyltransferase-2
LRKQGVRVGGANAPVVGVHPGGKWEVKRWPVRRFAELAGKLERERGARVIAFTGPGEESLTRELAAGAGSGIVCLPELPIRKVGALLSLLDGMVVSDGGIMHLSVAVGTPTVGIFGSAMPDTWFPYETLGPFLPAFVEVPCRPCHRHVCPLGHTDCLNRLTADMVLSRLDDARHRRGVHADAR